MSKEVSFVLPENEKEQYVQVPIKKKDFGDFITNLLGQPENISGKKVGVFKVNLQWLINLHLLIDTRIKQQSKADLVDFSTVFSYRDSAERKVTTVEGLLNFNEARIVTTKGVKLSWTYLVNFPNKKAPEKQEISVSLFTDKTEVVQIGGTSITRKTTNKSGIITYSISHTERTWGDDIQSILDKEINKLFEVEKWYESLLLKLSSFIALSFFVLGIIIPDIIEQIIREKETAKIFDYYLKNGISINEISQNEKLNLVIQLLDSSNQSTKVNGFYRVLSFIGGIFLAVLTTVSIEKEKSSHIVITEKDLTRQNSTIEKEKKSKFKSILSFSLAIAAGVAGNYFFYYLNING